MQARGWLATTLEKTSPTRPRADTVEGKQCRPYSRSFKNDTRGNACMHDQRVLLRLMHYLTCGMLAAHDIQSAFWSSAVKSELAYLLSSSAMSAEEKFSSGVSP